MSRLSLFARYWLVLAAIATVPILLAGLIEGWFVYREAHRAAIDRQLLKAQVSAFQVERAVLPLLDRLTIVASLPWNYATSTDDEQRKEMLRVVRQFPVVARMQRVSADGHVLASVAQNGEERSLGAAEIEALRAARRAAERTEPVLTRPGGTAPLSIAYAERGTDNWLVADLALDVMSDLVTRGSENAGNFVFITDGSGTILAHPDLYPAFGAEALQELRGWRSVATSAGLFDPAAPAEASLGEIRAEISSDRETGDEWFAAYRRVDRLGWFVFALAPSRALHAQIRAAVARTGIIVASANVVALLLALALAHGLSRPLLALSRASQRVAAGELSARAEVLSDDEIGRVSGQFNAMVGELQQSYGQLEARVAEKTAELQQASRHKSEFLAQMSHELRTPLNAVIGFSDSLLQQYFGPINQKQRQYVENINASGQHLLALINDLLDLAKIEAGRTELALAPLDIARVVDDAITQISVRAEAKTIQLTSALAPQLGMLVADERKVKQVLLNLLANAVKFTDSGGRVELSVRREAPTSGNATVVRFAVTDNGRGIPPGDVSRLFKEFGQVSQPGDLANEGTGLGLALSRRLVDLHEGRIGVESHVGAGSTFWFEVPDRPWPAS